MRTLDALASSSSVNLYAFVYVRCITCGVLHDMTSTLSLSTYSIQRLGIRGDFLLLLPLPLRCFSSRFCAGNLEDGFKLNELDRFIAQDFGIVAWLAHITHSRCNDRGFARLGVNHGELALSYVTHVPRRASLESLLFGRQKRASAGFPSPTRLERRSHRFCLVVTEHAHARLAVGHCLGYARRGERRLVELLHFHLGRSHFRSVRRSTTRGVGIDLAHEFIADEIHALLVLRVVPGFNQVDVAGGLSHL